MPIIKITVAILAGSFHFFWSLRSRLAWSDDTVRDPAKAGGADCCPLRFSGRLFFLAFTLAGIPMLQAAPPAWSFQPRKVGNVLVDGGWSLDYSLGEINGSPEFSFPLQLVYLNTREARGIFGSQWFCPQLESSLLPKEAGILVWTMPSGGVLGFKAQLKHVDEFVSFDGEWRAKRSGLRFEIFNADGWKYAYNKGRLDSIESPTGRLLEFIWSGTSRLSVQIRDSATGAVRVLLAVGFGENRCVATLQINGQCHQFGYIKDGPDDRLSGWTPPIGNPIGFLYLANSGVLLRAESYEGKKVVDKAEFSSVFVPPLAGTALPQGQIPQKNPKNYWLKSDPTYDYKYPGNAKQLATGQVTAKSKTGFAFQVSQSPARGIVTSKTASTESKTYFYKAPGQKYDGKLRRVETDGQLQVEYRYDRKTGLLSESLDANGISTFFEYPKVWKPARAPLMEPKPVRITRGSRTKNELVAEFAYDDYGRVVVTKDAGGQLTRYSYTTRGELQSVTGPDGDRTTFSYDSFGRRTTVVHNDTKESVVFDDDGRVKTRVGTDGSRTDFSFNKQGQLAAVARDGKPMVEFLHDSQGRIAGEKDPLGRIKNVERDLRGNVLTETAPNGSVTRYEYDEFNRRTAQIDGNGNKIAFAYDAAGHLVGQINPLGGKLIWTYDKNGRLTERNNGEQPAKYSYDATGKLTTLDYGNGQTITYAYDKDGRMVSATTPDTGFEYFYDKLGRTEAIELREGANGSLMSFRYNPRGQRTSLVIADLVAAVPTHGDHAGKDASYEPIQQTDYAYDASGRIASITSNGQPVVTYAYDSAGRPIRKTFGNGVVASLSYDTAGRLARISFSGGPVGSPLDLVYQWDAASQLTSRTWNGQTQLYTYDPSGQLLTVSEPVTREATNGTKGEAKANTVSREGAKDAKAANQKLLESYAYDKAGNMIEKLINGKKTTMTYDAANQLKTATVSSGALPQRADAPASAIYIYDRAGRLLTSDDSPTRTYGWLDKVTKLTTQTGNSLTLTYWPDGQLAAKKKVDPQISPINAEKAIQQVSTQSVKSAQSADETFLWDGLALLRRNDTIYIIEPHPSGGVPIASYSIENPAQVTYYLNDMLGTALATVEGTATHFASRTAFGQPLKRNVEIPSPSGLGGTTVPNPMPQTESLPRTP